MVARRAIIGFRLLLNYRYAYRCGAPLALLSYKSRPAHSTYTCICIYISLSLPFSPAKGSPARCYCEMAREGESESESERGNRCTRGLQWQQQRQQRICAHLEDSLRRCARNALALARGAARLLRARMIMEITSSSYDLSIRLFATTSLLDPLQARCAKQGEEIKSGPECREREREKQDAASRRE